MDKCWRCGRSSSGLPPFEVSRLVETPKVDVSPPTPNYCPKRGQHLVADSLMCGGTGKIDELAIQNGDPYCSACGRPNEPIRPATRDCNGKGIYRDSLHASRCPGRFG